MQSLPDLQRALGAAILDANRAGAVTGLLVGAASVARLGVYRGNVFGNWGNALANAYPIVRRIVGESFFAGLAHAYAHAHPSRSGDLNEYGESLPQFVGAFAATQDLPYLADVARMEWSVHRAWFAADSPPFEPARLGRVPAAGVADLRPVLAAAVGLIASRWPLARLWEAHQPEQGGPVDVDLRAGGDHVLVDRPGWRPRVRAIGRGDFRFLVAAARGDSLGAALVAAGADDPRFCPEQALARWVADGVITDLV